MKVQQFLKDIRIDDVFTLLIEHYNMNVKKDELKSAISTILSLQPTSTYGDGIIVFKSFFDETAERVYATSSLMYPYGQRSEYHKNSSFHYTEFLI